MVRAPALKTSTVALLSLAGIWLAGAALLGPQADSKTALGGMIESGFVALGFMALPLALGLFVYHRRKRRKTH